MTNQLTARQECNGPANGRKRSDSTYIPRFDIWETEEELILHGDMPGVSAEDLDIDFEDDQLTIHGRVKPRHDGWRLVGGEYGIGDFYRTFTIGEAIDSARISAELAGGVLTLHLPKTEAVKPRRIEVRSV